MSAQERARKAESRLTVSAGLLLLLIATAVALAISGLLRWWMWLPVMLCFFRVVYNMITGARAEQAAMRELLDKRAAEGGLR